MEAPAKFVPSDILYWSRGRLGGWQLVRLVNQTNKFDKFYKIRTGEIVPLLFYFCKTHKKGALYTFSKTAPREVFL